MSFPARIVEFGEELRAEGLQVGTSALLDAFAAIEQVDWEDQDVFRETLLSRRSAELDRGVTLVGPHRDDLVLRVRGLPVKGYASHGESWSVALALRLASAELLRA